MSKAPLSRTRAFKTENSRKEMPQVLEIRGQGLEDGRRKRYKKLTADQLQDKPKGPKYLVSSVGIDASV